MIESQTIILARELVRQPKIIVALITVIVSFVFFALEWFFALLKRIEEWKIKKLERERFVWEDG